MERVSPGWSAPQEDGEPIRKTVGRPRARGEAVGYIGPVDPEVRGRFDHIIGTLVRIIHTP